MQDETNEELYQHLFGRGWAWFMVKTAALGELTRRSDGGDIEAANYLQLYKDGVNVSKQPRLIIKYKFIL